MRNLQQGPSGKLQQAKSILSTWICIWNTWSLIVKWRIIDKSYSGKFVLVRRCQYSYRRNRTHTNTQYHCGNSSYSRTSTLYPHNLFRLPTTKIHPVQPTAERTLQRTDALRVPGCLWGRTFWRFTRTRILLPGTNFLETIMEAIMLSYIVDVQNRFHMACLISRTRICTCTNSAIVFSRL